MEKAKVQAAMMKVQQLRGMPAEPTDEVLETPGKTEEEGPPEEVFETQPTQEDMTPSEVKM